MVLISLDKKGHSKVTESFRNNKSVEIIIIYYLLKGFEPNLKMKGKMLIC